MRLALLLALPLIAQAQHAAGCLASFSNPGWNGACYLAVPLVPAQGLYSWTMAQRVQGQVITSTGLALALRSFTSAKGTLQIIGIGQLVSRHRALCHLVGPRSMWISKSHWTWLAGGIANKGPKATTTDWIMGPGVQW